MNLDDAATRVGAALIADAASAKLLKQVTALVRSLRGQGVELIEDVEDAHLLAYVQQHTFPRGKAHTARNATRPSAATMRNRRWAVTEFFSAARRLRLTERAVGVDLVLAPRPGRVTRPLTDAEVWTCEQVARPDLFTSRGPAVLALAEAGGAQAEIGAVRVEDVDLAAGTVWFLGARAHILPRRNALTPWGVDALRRYVADQAETQAGSPLVVAATATPESATSSVSAELKRIIDRAGLRDDPKVAPQSVRAWSGRATFDRTGDLITAARWLGVVSFDQAADIIGLERGMP